MGIDLLDTGPHLLLTVEVVSGKSTAQAGLLLRP